MRAWCPQLNSKNKYNMFKSALYALGTAFVAVSAIAPAQAASNPAGRVATAADVRSMLSDDLGLKFSIDDDGDIKIRYSEGFTVWVILMDKDYKHVDANSNGSIAVVKFLAIPVATSDTSSSTLNRMMTKAERLNDEYRFKFYAKTTQAGTAIFMERYEFLTPESRRGPLAKAYTMFARTVNVTNE